MRVTTNMMINSITRNLFKQSESLLNAQTKLATGKEINKPSDDPIGIGRILKYRTALSSIDQYSSNVTKGKSWIKLSETTMESIESQLEEVIKIAEEQSSGDLEDRESTVEIVKDLYAQIMELANTKSTDGRYLFAGQQTDTPPFSRDEDYNATYSGDDGDIKIITGEGATKCINISGSDLFMVDGVSVFDLMSDLISGLENPDTSAGNDQISALIDPLNEAVTQVRNNTAKIAATYTTLELTENRLSDLQSNIEDMLDDQETADTTQAAIELQALETTYETTLEVAAMITSQASLMDFI